MALQAFAAARAGNHGRLVRKIGVFIEPAAEQLLLVLRRSCVLLGRIADATDQEDA